MTLNIRLKLCLSDPERDTLLCAVSSSVVLGRRCVWIEESSYFRHLFDSQIFTRVSRWLKCFYALLCNIMYFISYMVCFFNFLKV